MERICRVIDVKRVAFFLLLSVTVAAILECSIFIGKPNGVYRCTLLSVGIFTCLTVVMWWISKQDTNRKLTPFEFLFCLFCLAFFSVWACSKPFDYAPDEAMRYDVTRFMYENNRLPVGDELLSHWGFSYAHTPAVLCNQLGYVFMKITSLFTEEEFHLLLSARMVSVFCGTCAVYYLFKIGKQIFSPVGKWIMVIFIAMMPQFPFLSSYVNNDMVAFLGVTMILYAWILGIKDGWNLRNSTLLAIGISICALAYYNSYAWILFSIFFYFATQSYEKKDRKTLIRLTIYIIVVVFCLIGYSFIRHLVLYKDLLGFKTSRYYGEMYAIDELKPSNRLSVAKQGVSLIQMVFDRSYGWILSTWNSFIGVFGYMEYPCPRGVYLIITLFVFVGGIGAICCMINRVQKGGFCRNECLFLVFIICCAFVTVGLSVYNSYTKDFQAQGRYCYPAFPTLAILVTAGYEYWLEKIKNSRIKYAVGISLCVMICMVSLFVFKNVYLPS